MIRFLNRIISHWDVNKPPIPFQPMLLASYEGFWPNLKTNINHSRHEDNYLIHTATREVVHVVPMGLLAACGGGNILLQIDGNSLNDALSWVSYQMGMEMELEMGQGARVALGNEAEVGSGVWHAEC
ncbi:hypothetical protein ACLKA7_012187 [Drosophila subpalustris]